jgi:hypothetical protein
MEAGTGFICEGSGRIGSWFTYRDEASMITPPPSQVPALPVEITSRPGSRRAMYAYGTTTSYAGLGCVINNSVIGERPGTFDASRYQGIRFSGRSSNGWIKLAVHTPATVVVTNGGTCPATLNCIANQVAISVNSSIWNDITVPFARLEGGAAPFDPSQIWSIEFQSYVGSFDVWVDDLSFY